MRIRCVRLAELASLYRRHGETSRREWTGDVVPQWSSTCNDEPVTVIRFLTEHNMSKSTGRKIFVNLAVKDLKRAKAFFSALGFEYNPKFSDDNGTCMIISDEGYVMLLAEPFFKTFTTREVCD